jgi:hypothetical protein
MEKSDSTKLPLASMDAGLLRQIAAKIDDDEINVRDGKVLRSVADSIDAVLAALDEQRTEQALGDLLARYIADEWYGDPEDKPGNAWYDISEQSQTAAAKRADEWLAEHRA